MRKSASLLGLERIYGSLDPVTISMPRHYRRRSAPQAIVQSFKKVLNFAPAGHSAGLKIDNVLALGTDSVAAGQTGVTDPAVPTGSIIKAFVIQYAVSNLVGVSAFQHISIQSLKPSQGSISPNVVGGNPQRNQVYFQSMRVVGPNQNANYNFVFKVPKKYQRVREGDNWLFTVLNTAAVTDSLQVIYKFYR